ncbi:MAG: spore maturation protein CgeB [Actinomycetota bacterium]|nr:spore maturation protein CgeB [Actinomycetota bacterium]
MRILFAAHRHDYGRPERGLSFEYFNFYEPLTHLGHDVTFFDIGEHAPAGAPASADEALAAAVRTVEPDLLFTFLYADEISPEAVATVTAAGVPTLNWFADDHWRFEAFSSRYAPSYAWIATTAASALPKYAALGCTNVIKTQWAAAHHRYRPSGEPLRYDATFVGQVYGERPALVARLRAEGVQVRTWGTGWAERRWHRAVAHRPVVRSLGGRRVLAAAQARTRCSQEEMIRIFGTSRINLNFTEASQGPEAQIKGRTFEVPACGGFLLTGRSAHLEEYYEPDREVVVFDGPDELVDKVTYYLAHDDERSRVAEAGLRRTLAEHTYEQRLTRIFDRMGLAVGG